MNAKPDTIAAIATPAGRGGVGMVRVSGPAASAIALRIGGICPPPRQAVLRRFFADAAADSPDTLDFGLLLFFQAPHSFTGEDVLELHGHGGPVVMQRLLDAVVAAGARLARPGEFSERAFLNDKMDLAQAEAVADLIDSATTAAARSALRSLSGEFSAEIDALVESVTVLRVHVEAAIDFPDEEIDFLSDHRISGQLQAIDARLDAILRRARNGRLLREGAHVVIAGKPNAGKSSLLNRLTGTDTAIVTPVPGTTRDVLREHINLDGMPLYLVDTAGLRDSSDSIEQEGIRRAGREIARADLVLLVVDATEPLQDPRALWQSLSPVALEDRRLLVVLNKTDCSGQPAGRVDDHTVALSALRGDGLEALRDLLKEKLGFSSDLQDSVLARQRHLDALQRAHQHLHNARLQLQQGRGELLAEDLRACQDALGEITGAVHADALLGRIFSSFCIGK